MHSDVRGLALTTESAEAAAAFNATIDEYLIYRSSAMKTLGGALEADPAFVMGHCLKGYLFMLFSSNQVMGKVAESLAAADAGVARTTPREQAHVEALRAWSTGDLARSDAIWDEILVDNPLDILALRLQHFNTFWMGRSLSIRDGVARVLHAWDESMPGYGSILGMYSFGLEEAGEYARAEDFGRRAVEINGDDLWAIHAVAHVLEMQGRAADGRTWLSQDVHAWDDRNPFKGHVWWHTAMFAMAQGDFDSVLEIYDHGVASNPSDFYLDVQNAASMLARLDLLGVDVGKRWESLADIAEQRTGDHMIAFTEMHYMMALVHEGRLEAAQKLLDSLHAFAETPNNFAAGAMKDVGNQTCEAILAYGKGQYGEAIDLMLPIRSTYARVGASHAQRDIFAQFLIDAAQKDGQLKLARTLLSERIEMFPQNVAAWNSYADTLSGLGDAAAAEAAREKAAHMLAA
jgi:tetratricopeptide (TPR) repeat protein